MNKLFNLKEWLTVADAAKHLSIIFGEDVTEADVLRLALDRRLRLSVYIVNGTEGLAGRVIPIDEAEYKEVPAFYGKGTLRLYEGPTLFFEGRATSVVKLEEELSRLQGIYDLPMIGSERLDVEHKYQILTGGPAVTLLNLDGAFVEGRDGQVCQLQEYFDENEHQPGSSAQLGALAQHIADHDIVGAEAESLLSRAKEQRKNYLETRWTRPAKENYNPAGGLPEDAVIVVRTEALREFERRGNDAPFPTSRAHVSDKLAKTNQAAAKWWGNADSADRGTHPDNAIVAAWLVGQGFSPTLADKAATIIRPEWAPTGRKPEE